MTKIVKALQFCEENEIHAQKDPLLSEYTSFQIGGPAFLLAEPNSEDQIKKLLRFCKEQNLPTIFIGHGSNLLAPDEGIKSVIIRLDRRFGSIKLLENEIIECESGASLISLCRFAQQNSLTGLEFAFGIPGNVGGAVYMNAGAYGGEIKDVLLESEHIDSNTQNGVYSVKQLNMSYRHSIYSEFPELCITKCRFQLKKGNITDITDKMNELMKRRIEKQPLEWPSAGSVFKRPEGNYASALIDQCGLKGYCIGDACISEKHCGFIVNKGKASEKDVKNLIRLIQDTVNQKTGYLLECEIKML